MTPHEIIKSRNSLIDLMRDKVSEQKKRKANGKDNARYILSGFSIEQLNQVSNFLISFKDYGNLSE